jgi:hypothetical protein
MMEELEKEVHGMQAEEVRERERESVRREEEVEEGTLTCRLRVAFNSFLSRTSRAIEEAGNAIVLLLGPRGARRIRAASSS